MPSNDDIFDFLAEKAAKNYPDTRAAQTFVPDRVVCMRTQHLCSVEANMPPEVRNVLDEVEGSCLAGGFIRAMFDAKPYNDYDIFVQKIDDSIAAENILMRCGYEKVALTRRAVSMRHNGVETGTIQIVYNWPFDNPVHLLQAFDFVNCAGAVYSKDGDLHGLVLDGFYDPLLILKATRALESYRAYGSIADSAIRMVKFAARGYCVPNATLATVIGAVSKQYGTCEREQLQNIFESVTGRS